MSIATTALLLVLGQAPMDADEVQRDLEIGALPALSYDSDVGFGFGILAVLARPGSSCEPFCWRMETLLSVTVKENQLGEWDLPFHDDYVRLDIPDVGGSGLRLLSEVGFRKLANAGWYGFGSAAQETTFSDAELREDEQRKRFHQVDHIFPSVRAALRLPWLELGDFELDGFVTVGGLYSHAGVYPASRFEESLDQRPSEPALRELFFGSKDHGLIAVGGGLLLDSRDDEFVPTRGVFAELGLRGGLMTRGSRVHGAATASLSGFLPLGVSWLVLGGRTMADLTWGDAPFYELSRIGTFAPEYGPGGGRAVRGVHTRRFHGKIRCVGNVELRALSSSFEIWDNRFRVGGVLFADTGRVWADWVSREIAATSLDGGADDWSVGLGGGVRILWGSTFVIRIDQSGSPTEGTSGTYVGVGNLF